MKKLIPALLLLLSLLLAACGNSSTPEPTPDVAAVRTSAASTVESKYTLTAAVFTPTLPPPIPTDTPMAEVTDTLTPETIAVSGATYTPVPCDLLSYDITTVDVSVPDNTIMSPGQDFVKTWKVKNVGSCPWGAGYALDYAGYSDKLSGQFIAMNQVIQPGEEVDVSVQFKAPEKVGEYLSAWTMRNPKGVAFPEIIFVKIIVQ